MVFDGCYFKYGDFNSRNYNLIFAHMDTEPMQSVSGAISSVNFFNKKTNRNYLSADDYRESPITYEAEIITVDASPIASDVRRSVEKSLFNLPRYQRLYADVSEFFCSNLYWETTEMIDGVAKRLYLNCRFLQPTKIEDGAGRTVGYKFTVECDSGYMTQDDITKSFDFSNEQSEGSFDIEIDIDTDMHGFTYPKVNITAGNSGGDITIINYSDASDRITKFIDIPANSYFTMNGEINYVSGQYFSKFEDRNFIRLVDGKNHISIFGDVKSISFNWSNRRFL